MTRCCDPDSYERVFSRRQARWAAARYRRRGLGWDARQTAELFAAGLIKGSTLLEIGGGIGDLQVELLRLGVDRAVSVELSPSYEEKAAELLRDAGLEGRVTRLLGDIVTMADQVEPADLVVLHSVIFCYPDMERLVETAASKARQFLMMSYPPDTWLSRLWAWISNLWQERVKNSQFRYYIHPPPRMLSTVRGGGMRPIHEKRSFIGHVAAFERQCEHPKDTSALSQGQNHQRDSVVPAESNPFTDRCLLFTGRPQTGDVLFRSGEEE